MSFCEDHLIHGSPIEGGLVSSQIDKLSDTTVPLGEKVEDEIIPLVRECKCVELEQMQGQLADLKKFMVDHAYLGNIDLEWVYKPYRHIFNRAVLNLPKELSQQTINLFL